MNKIHYSASFVSFKKLRKCKKKKNLKRGTMPGGTICIAVGIEKSDCKL